LKKAVLVLAVLLFTLSLTAQLRTGNIYGKIVDKEKKALPGVAVTLTGPYMTNLTTVTNASGVFRFLAVFPGRDYNLKAELVGYKTVNRGNIIVTVGGNSRIDMTFEAGKLEEQVTVKAVTPIIDVRQAAVLYSIGKEEMQMLPTARDPWVIIQLAPSVMLDRENVGGSESGQQASFVAKGDNTNGANNIWAIDGIDITDPSTLGDSALFFDFDMFEELNIATGGAADVGLQTGGIALNMVTRRGGNKLSLAGRFYLTDRSFQSDNMTAALQEKGVSNTNKIRQIKDYGVSIGGPIVKDRLWWWGAYGVQDLFLYSIYNTRNQTLLNNYNFKLNAQPFAGNRFEAMVTSGGKEILGLNAFRAKPEGDLLTGMHRGGNPIIKIQDEQVIGNNFYVSLKYSFNDAGSRVRPVVDEDMIYPVAWDVGNEVYIPFSSSFGRSWDSSLSSRRRNNYQFMATLFRDSLLGVSHEIKGGFEYSVKKAAGQWGYSQNFEVRRNYVEPMINMGEGLVVPPPGFQYIQFGRETRDLALAEHASGYLQDTITKGRFTLMLGLRYDHQAPSTGAYMLETVKPANLAWNAVFSSNAMNALYASCPAISVRAIDPKYQWSTWSPRIGLTWDITGDGRTVAKLGLSQYGDVMGVGAYTPQPLGLGGGMGFWWQDVSLDNYVQLDEIYWQYSSTHPQYPSYLYGLYDSDGTLTDLALAALEGGFESDAYRAGNYWGFDWANPTAVNYDNLTTFFRSDVDPDAKNVKSSPRTREILLALEREVFPDLSVAANAIYRRYDNFDWAKPFYPADIYPSTPDLVIDDTQTWYTIAGTVPSTVVIGGKTYSMKDAAGKRWYLPVENYPGATPYRMVDKSRMYRTYLGLDIVVNKRLSNRWFMNASLTLQDQRVHWNGSYIDPTNKWALDGKPFGNWGGGSDYKVPVQMYTRWMAKVSGLYQLPLGFDVSGTLIAREGWKIPNYVTLAYAGNDPWPGLYKSNVVYLETPTKDSLPTFYNLTFRVEKKLNLGSGRIYLMADVFNVFNSAIVNRAYDANYGTYYVNTQESAANPTNRLYNEILNPRIWRFGVRFEF
jgi:hypothetical protein